MQRSTGLRPCGFDWLRQVRFNSLYTILSQAGCGYAVATVNALAQAVESLLLEVACQRLKSASGPAMRGAGAAEFGCEERKCRVLHQKF